MDIYQVVVNFNEGNKDYVSATIYHNDNFYKSLDDIAKPENVDDYNAKWCNGLVFHYGKLAHDLLPAGARIITLWKDLKICNGLRLSRRAFLFSLFYIFFKILTLIITY